MEMVKYMKNKTWLIVSIAIVILILVIAIIGFNSSSTGLLSLGGPTETLKIGIVATQTGVGAYHGEQEIKAVNLAVEEINAKGGINGKKIELIVEDSQSVPKEAVNAVNKLVNTDKVKFIVGDCWNDTTISFMQMTNDNKVIVVAPNVNLDQVSKDDYLFRLAPKTKDMMEVLANYAYNDLKLRKVGVILPGTSFSQEHLDDFTESFEKLGGTVVSQKITPGATDTRAELSYLKSQNVDAVLDLQFSALVGAMIKQGKELGMNVVWLSHYGAETNVLITDYKSVSDGLIYPYIYDTENKNSQAQSFIEKYKAKYNEYPDSTAANSYDSIMVLAKAIEKAGENTDKVKAELENTKNYQGVSGIFSFDKNGDVQKKVILKQVQDGKFVKIFN